MSELFPNFLTDEAKYAQAEAFWADLWQRTPELERRVRGWRAGWFDPQPPKDANPIFSAVSDIEQKGIRVIQYESTTERIELDFWLDSFGGCATDPDAIRELVIACALSTESSQAALKLMSSWIVGEIELANASGVPQGLTTIQPTSPRWKEFPSYFDFGHLIPAA